MNERQISIVVIGAGNRANKYLEYVIQNRQKVKLVGVVEPVDLRRERVAEEFNLEPSNCFTCYEQFFAAKIQADAVFRADILGKWLFKRDGPRALCPPTGTNRFADGFNLCFRNIRQTERKPILPDLKFTHDFILRLNTGT